MDSLHLARAGHNVTQALQLKWRLLLIATVALLLYALQYLPIRADGSIGGVGDICPFRNLTNLPCPLCGLTRSALSFFQGDFHASLLWHPLGPLLGIGLILAFVAMAIPAIGIKNLTAKMSQQRCGVALIVVVAGCWALRLAGIFPLPLSP